MRDFWVYPTIAYKYAPYFLDIFSQILISATVTLSNNLKVFFTGMLGIQKIKNLNRIASIIFIIS